MIDATVRWMLSLLTRIRISMMTSRPMTPMSKPLLEYCFSAGRSSPVTTNPPSSSSTEKAAAAAVVAGALSVLSSSPPKHATRASTPATARTPATSRLTGLGCTFVLSIHLGRAASLRSSRDYPVSLLPISAAVGLHSDLVVCL